MNFAGYRNLEVINVKDTMLYREPNVTNVPTDDTNSIVGGKAAHVERSAS